MEMSLAVTLIHRVPLGQAGGEEQARVLVLLAVDGGIHAVLGFIPCHGPHEEAGATQCQLQGVHPAFT